MRRPRRRACLRSGPEHAHGLGESANRDHGSDGRGDTFLAVAVARAVRREEESGGKHEIAVAETMRSVSWGMMMGRQVRTDLRTRMLPRW